MVSANSNDAFSIGNESLQPADAGRYETGATDRNSTPSLHDLDGSKPAPSLVEISPGESVKRRAQSWASMTAELVQTTSRIRTEYRFRASTHLLIAYEQGVRHDGETFMEGLPPSKLRNLKRRLTFVPAGHQYREWHEPHTLARLVYFYLDPRSGPADVTLRPRLFFEDAVLWDTALKLKALVENQNSEDRQYWEALGAVLWHELARLDRSQPGHGPRARGGLAAWQQRMVVDYIEEHLAEEVRLATLARLIGLSRFHFSRAFKQSLGLSPHRYHTNRRIERAKAMLAKRGFSVTDIGFTLGFGSTSSFTTAFRKATGFTPTGFHRRLASLVEPEGPTCGPSLLSPSHRGI